MLLGQVYRTSGLTAADLAAASGLSTSAVRIALAGLRYRQGEPRVTAPTDQTLAKLASALGISSQTLAAVGRGRAASMLDEAETTPPADLDTSAAIAGRLSLARQILAQFSTEELRAELERRDQAEHDELDREAIDDIAEDLKTERFPG